MDFGVKHNTAMDVRLRKFFFKSLTSLRVAGVQEFLRANAMDCIVWACGLAHTPENELPLPVPGTSSQQDDLGEEEKERIRTIQLNESESEPEGSEQAEPNTTIEDSDFQGENEDGDTDSTYLDQWEESLRIVHVCENNSLATVSRSGNSVYLPLKLNAL